MTLLATLLLSVSAFAQQPAAPAAKPRLAIVIDDFGLTYPRDVPDEDWMKITWPITFADMPVSPRTKKINEEAPKWGHELIIHFPFDKYLSLKLPKDHVDPEDLQKVDQLMDKAFAQVTHAVGLNNHQSYRGTMNRPMMEAFMQRLKPHGIYFLDSHVSSKSVAYEEARKAGIPAAVNSYFLDGLHEPKGRHSHDPKILAETIAQDKAFCEHYLRATAQLARKNGHAVAIGHHYYHGTYECLMEEVPKLQAEGIEFVFASAIAK